ncbi:MAG: endonuclease MutS2, partial [Dehalococcoidia bacterium]
TLEFDKVLDRLAGLTSFSAGRDAALELQPSSDLETARQRQALTAEARHLRSTRPNLGLGGAHDVRPQAGKAALSGVLDPNELLDIHSTLVLVRTLRGNLTRLAQRYPLLAELSKAMFDLGAIVTEIARCITSRGEVADSASPALAAVRREGRIVHDRLNLRLQEILGSAVSKGVAQEALVTERDGRYVIPVKADFRGQLRGIVHDVSSSGATLWIEPLAVVDLGNQYRELQLEEQREVERVLRSLSALVGASAAQIAANVERLAELDVHFAAVRLGETLRADDLPDDGAEQSWIVPAPAELRLVEARHPLLTGEVVPTSLQVGGEFHVLLITGPNTGGKTVALKTAGLLTLMALAGLPVPARPLSQVPVFESVFADIGDEQSIEQSLSTFSSHMRNIIAILEHAGPRSLVLLDELGAGTDPQEGAALARAIVEHLLERGCTVIATTHHGELKVYAHQTPGVTNANVEFDYDTLAPTYRLTIGLPGRRTAIAIASRLGMPAAVLSRARDEIGPAQEKVEDLLSDLQRERDRLAATRRAEVERAAQAGALQRKLEAELDDVQRERDAMLEAARDELERELAEVRAQLREASRHAERSARVERGVSSFPPVPMRDAQPAPLQQPALELAAAADAVEAADAHVARLRRRAPSRPSAQPQGLRPEQILAGDRITIRGVEQAGEALVAPDDKGELDVQLGQLRMRIRLDQVEKISRSATTSPPPPMPRLAATGQPAPGVELDMRGQHVEEALPRIEAYVESAFLAGMPFVRIVHGKGTGTLRRVVREVLAKNPLVSQLETPEQRAGGEGVTIVRLAV